MQNNRLNRAGIEFLYTNIGRGHPFYLDGIADALIRSGQIGLVRRETDVFAISTYIARWGWQAARWLYRRGASDGWIGSLYRHLREGQDYNQTGLWQRLMGRDIYRTHRFADSPLLVAHPSLVGILAGRKNLIYQHGEVVAPNESLVTGADYVIVPTPDVAAKFIGRGYDRSQVFVSNLCLEPALVVQGQDAMTGRMERLLDGTRPTLTGAFYSSGAEPARHILALAESACSVVRGGHRAICFARSGGRFERTLRDRCSRAGVPLMTLDPSDPVPADLPEALLVLTRTRREENALTARLFPHFDYFVAPPHERSNWALGLGLPAFLVGGDYGPYAPQNRSLLLSRGVAQVLPTSPETFCDMLTALRDRNDLAAMARQGWGMLGNDGFARIADFLVDRYLPKR